MGCHATKQKKRKSSVGEHLSLPDTHESVMNQKLLTPDTRLQKKNLQKQQPLNKNKLIDLLDPEHQSIQRFKKFQNDYFILQDKIIDKGRNGRVLVVEHKVTGIKRMAKIARLSVNDVQLERIVKQLQALKRLDHPNLIKLFDFYNDDKHLYLVEEYCEGGNLFERLSDELKMKEKIHVTFVFQQVLSALSYLHGQGIIHKNIKTSNIVVSSKEKFLVKLIGYEDLSDMFFESEEDFSYRAPETFRDNYAWNETADIWSAGVVLYELCVGVHPFKGQTNRQTIENIKQHHFQGMDAFKEQHEDIVNLISSMLDVYPKMRNTAKDCLKSKYFKNIRRTSVKISSVLARMSQFQRNNELKQILLSLMIDYLLPKEERDKMAQVFYQIDTNCDGKISKSELFISFKKNLPDEQAKKEVDKIFSKIDLNGNDSIEFNEFLIVSCNQQDFLTEDNLKEFFTKLDRDHSQHISATELKMLFCNVNINDKEWKQIISLGDKDDNDRISYKEFVSLMTEQNE